VSVTTPRTSWSLNTLQEQTIISTNLAVREVLMDMSSSLTGCKSKTASFKLFQTGGFGAPDRVLLCLCSRKMRDFRSTIVDKCYGKTAFLLKDK